MDNSSFALWGEEECFFHMSQLWDLPNEPEFKQAVSFPSCDPPGLSEAAGGHLSSHHEKSQFNQHKWWNYWFSMVSDFTEGI